MVRVDEAFELRYKKGGENFELLIDFDTYEQFKKKPDEISAYDVLADTKIYKDQRKGDVASEHLLESIFPNKTEEEIIKEMLLQGEPQIPTAYLNKLREEKKTHIINYIVTNAINAQTKGKFTPSMIEAEVNKLKLSIDYRRDAGTQAEEIVKLLKKVMPISMQKVIIEMKIPGMHCGHFYGPFRKFGKITKEFFDDHGNLHLHMEIPESIIEEVTNFIKRNSNGEGEYVVSH